MNMTIKLWDVETGQCLRTFEEGTLWIHSVSFSPDGKYALSGSDYHFVKDYKKEGITLNTLKMWDINVFSAYADWSLCRIRTVQETLGHEQLFTKTVEKSKMKMNSGDIAAALTELSAARSIPGFARAMQCLELNAQIGRYCRVIGLQTAWLERTLAHSERTLIQHRIESDSSISFSSDGKYKLSASGGMELWDVKSGECIRTFIGHRQRVGSVCFSPNGKYALSGTINPRQEKDNTVKLWDIETGQCLRTFEERTLTVFYVSFSIDSKYAISAISDSEVSKGIILKLWRLDWNYEFPGWADWDDGAEPYLRNFLTVRNGKWNEEDLKWLINDLQNRGYGWLCPEGIRKKLEEMGR